MHTAIQVAFQFSIKTENTMKAQAIGTGNKRFQPIKKRFHSIIRGF